MRRVFAAALLLAAFAVPAPAAGAEEPAEEKAAEEPVPVYDGPASAVRDIRSIFALQDAVASGHVSAIALQKSMLAQVADKLLGEAPAADPNRLAPNVAGYVLSGGNPQVAEKLAAAAGTTATNARLLKGAAFYMRGKREEAAAQWATLDLALLAPTAAGRVALAKAMLAGTDLEEKQQLLRMSVALLPGSLVEESALRRSALAYAEAGAEHEFWRQAERYLRRFPRSLYAPEFMYELTNTVIAMTKAGKKPDLARFDLLLGSLPVSNRQKLYLALARDAAERNLQPLSQFAARRLRRLSPESGTDAQIADVYDWIFEVASGSTEIPAARLRALDRKRLPEREQRLLDAALAVTEQILKPAAAVATPAAAAMEANQPKSALQQRAELALTKADEILAEPVQ